MVMCNRQEWLVDLVREPGTLLPLRPDTIPQAAPYLNRMSGHASGVASALCHLRLEATCTVVCIRTDNIAKSVRLRKHIPGYVSGGIPTL